MKLYIVTNNLDVNQRTLGITTQPQIRAFFNQIILKEHETIKPQNYLL